MKRVLPALLLLACTDPAKNGGSVRVFDTATSVTDVADTDTDTDADADSDTDTDSDTDVDTDTGTVPTGVTTIFLPSCDEQIPADVIVVDSNMVETTPDASYWVCAHKVLSYSGTGAKIFMENSADVVLNGTDNFVWMQSNSDLAAFLDPNEVLHEPGAAINDESAAGITLTQCATINYDYSIAPPGGC